MRFLSRILLVTVIVSGHFALLKHMMGEGSPATSAPSAEERPQEAPPAMLVTAPTNEPEPEEQPKPAIEQITHEKSETSKDREQPQIRQAEPTPKAPERPRPAVIHAATPEVTVASRASEPSRPEEISHEDQMVELYEAFEGEYIPQLVLRYDTPNIHRGALRHFGFRLLARPPASVDFYYEQTSGGSIVKRPGPCPHDGWSLESLPGDESFFATQATRDRLLLGQMELFYQSFDRRGEAYLRGIQLHAINEAGVTVDEVRHVTGQFILDGPDQYSLIIEGIHISGASPSSP